jgi:hypothetical protein
VFDTSCIGLISISNYELDEFPSCSSVQTLILRSFSQKLKRLGNYEHLEVLELTGGAYLESIGKIEKLFFLSLDSIGSYCLFPLEQLISFQLHYDGGKFERIQDRFLLLKSLQLNVRTSFSLSSHGSALKKLKTLSLTNYKIATLSGLDQLESLTVQLVVTLQGKEEIFPRLTSFQGDNCLLKDDINNCPELTAFFDDYAPRNLSVDQVNRCLQLPVVHMSVSYGSIRFPKIDLVLGDRVKTLQMSNVEFRSFQGVAPGRYFDEIMICGNHLLQNFSMFRNTQKLFLWSCLSITDIRLLRHVPYLVLGSCKGIMDYSCLGTQHYLEIVDSDELLDEHVHHFGKVRYLKIEHCSRITRIDRLTDNRFIKICECKSLREIVFNGFDYVEVTLSGCTKLASVSIHGQVYSLRISACSPVLKEYSLENYTYLDFQT